MNNLPEQIAIIASTVQQGDAVGHDVLKMRETLEKIGFDVVLIAMGFDDQITQTYQYKHKFLHQVSSLKDYAAVIYHHAIYLYDIERLLETTMGELIIRYHNVTPSSFFKPYKKKSQLAFYCKMGRIQIAQMVNRYKETAKWLADSHYNAQELIDWGVENRPDKITVSPPFMYLDQGRISHKSHKQPTEQANLLFVGRFAPNKGHKEMVKVIYAYKKYISNNIKLNIIGSHDPLLKKYDQEVEQLIKEFDLSENINIMSFVSDNELQQAYQQADVFLCMSQHEGFCVPIVEAQAMGLPIVATNTTAIGETLGPKQMSAAEPQTFSDYVYFAKMVEQATYNAELREALINQGFLNVAQRFAEDVLEISFVDNFYQLTQQ